MDNMCYISNFDDNYWTYTHYWDAQNHITSRHLISTVYNYVHITKLHMNDSISPQPNLKAYMLLMIFFFFLNGSQNPFRHLFNQLCVCQMRAPLKDPLVSIVALCDEFGTGFEKKSWIYNLCGRAEDRDSWRSEILHIAVMGIITQRKGLLG